MKIKKSSEKTTAPSMNEISMNLNMMVTVRHYSNSELKINQTRKFRMNENLHKLVPPRHTKKFKGNYQPVPSEQLCMQVHVNNWVRKYLQTEIKIKVASTLRLNQPLNMHVT